MSAAAAAFSLTASARVAPGAGALRTRRAVARGASRPVSMTVAADTSIQFVKGTNETSVPDVKLTRSKDGTNGTAFFWFSEPTRH